MAKHSASRVALVMARQANVSRVNLSRQSNLPKGGWRRGVVTAAIGRDVPAPIVKQDLEIIALSTDSRSPSSGSRGIGERRPSLRNAKPFSAFLTDTYHREHDYLRISITERCNLRCQYCMPEEGVSLSPKDNLLTSAEIFHLSKLFVSQGVTKIRLTGGEPTVRPDILDLMHSIGTLRSRGLRELCITTNGISLHRKLESMAEAGLTGVNLSLDTLDPFQFEIMTRRKGFNAVMRSIDRILEMNKLGAGIKLKINCVVMRGINDREILPFVEMGREKDVEIRFIEYMPFGGNKWKKDKMLSFKEMLSMIAERYPGLVKVQDHAHDTSKTYQVPGFVGRIGFITSMTHNFCGTCNRLRITADGNLKVCLFGNAEVSLRDLLRKDNDGRPMEGDALRAPELIGRQTSNDPVTGEVISRSDEELLNLIGMAVKRKKEKHAGMGQLENMENRPMILIDEPHDLFEQALPSVQTRLRDFTALPLFDLPLRGIGKPVGMTSRRCFSTTSSRGQASKDELSRSLTHLTATGDARMVDITHKSATHRVAVAIGRVVFSTSQPASLIPAALMKKGDVLATARIAAIMAAKQTASLIPLCHPIALTRVGVVVELEQAPGPAKSGILVKVEHPHGSVKVMATVECHGPTGVEMEALCAVMSGCLTVFDMCKGVDRGMRVEDVRVVFKKGGRSGEWREEGYRTTEEDQIAQINAD